MAYNVTITGSGNSTKCYVTVGDTKYYEAKTLAADEGTELYFYANGTSYGQIVLNGETLGIEEGSYVEHTMYVSGDVSVALSYSSIYNGYAAKITITHEIATDPLAPYDGHNTNIGSTAYQLESGTVLLDGVACEIELGMTLVGGVAYEIPFRPSVCTISITGSGQATECYVEINSERYYSAQTIEVEPGSEVYCYVRGMTGTSYVILDGETVASSRTAQYTYVAKKNTTINLYINGRDGGTITITTS